jgi:hypothetical protein
MYAPAAHRAGDALSTRTATVPSSVSAPLATSPACVVPPAQFGRPAQPVDGLSAKGPVAGLFGRPVRCSQAGSPSRTLSVVLDDPVAAARSLHNHMQPTDLLELIVILAEAAADGLRERTTTQ